MKKRLGAFLLAALMGCTALAGFAGCGVDKPDNAGSGSGTNNGGNGGNGGGNGGGSSNPTDNDVVVDLTADGGFEMPAGGFDTTKTVEITFYHTMGKNLREQLDYQLEEFAKLFPNITVTHEMIGKYDDVRDRISQEIIADNQPNIAYCYPDHVAQYNRAKAVQSMNDFLPGGKYADVDVAHADGTTEKLGLSAEMRSHFIPGFYNEGRMFDDGSQMYTLPFSKSTEVLYYNKKFFKDHEDKIQVPKTWDELEQVCAEIKKIDPDCIPFGYDSEANWFITMCEQLGSPYTVSTGPFKQRFQFDNETNREFVQRFKNWYDLGYFTTQGLWGSYTSSLFTSESEPKSYMCIGSSAGASNQQAPKIDNEYAFDVGITIIPQIDPEHPKVISQGPSICIFKDSDPQKVLASWLLVKYLTTNVEFQAAFSAESGYVPALDMEYMKTLDAYKESLDAANGTDGITALSSLRCLEQAAAYYTSPAFVGSSKARDEVGSLMQAVFSDSKSLDKAFTDAINACQSSI